MPKGGKQMSDEKNDGASKAPSEMTVRYYDAADVERLEILHKRMGGSLNAFLKSLIQAGYEKLAPVYLGEGQEPQKAAEGDPDLKETVIAAHETEMALLRRIEAQNSKILPSVYCVMNVVTPTDPEMRQIVDSGYMAAHYGLRREEIVGLKWSAIDFQYKTLTVRHTVTEYVIDGKPQLIARDAAKTSSSVRTLPLFPSVEDFLLKMKLEREDWERFYGAKYHHEADEYIYVNEDGTLMHPNYISRYFPMFLKKNGLRKIRFHDLRHTCATLLRHEGVPMEDIQKWLGHSEISTTERIYAHFDDRNNLPTSDKIAEAFGESKVSEAKPPKPGSGNNGPEM